MGVGGDYKQGNVLSYAGSEALKFDFCFFFSWSQNGEVDGVGSCQITTWGHTTMNQTHWTGVKVTTSATPGQGLMNQTLP